MQRCADCGKEHPEEDLTPCACNECRRGLSARPGAPVCQGCQEWWCRDLALDPQIKPFRPRSDVP